MNATLPRPLGRSLAVAAGIALYCAASCAAAEPASAAIAEAQAAYARERAVCLSGKSPQGEATCLKEAGAELEMVRDAGGKLPVVSPETLAANALRRCKAVAAADRYACEQMATGHGIVSGSVAGGGILKEFVTIIPGEGQVRSH